MEGAEWKAYLKADNKGQLYSKGSKAKKDNNNNAQDSSYNKAKRAKGDMFTQAELDGDKAFQEAMLKSIAEVIAKREPKQGVGGGSQAQGKRVANLGAETEPLLEADTENFDEPQRTAAELKATLPYRRAA